MYIYIYIIYMYMDIYTYIYMPQLTIIPSVGKIESGEVGRAILTSAVGARGCFKKALPAESAILKSHI